MSEDKGGEYTKRLSQELKSSLYQRQADPNHDMWAGDVPPADLQVRFTSYPSKFLMFKLLDVLIFIKTASVYFTSACRSLLLFEGPARPHRRRVQPRFRCQPQLPRYVLGFTRLIYVLVYFFEQFIIASFCQIRSVLPKDLLTVGRGPIPLRAAAQIRGVVRILRSCVFASHMLHSYFVLYQPFNRLL